MARTVFITGANSGVGLASTKLFAGEGWNVVATARDPASATHLQETANLYEHKILIVALDITKPSTYQQALDAAINKFGKVDVLVNNAGYGQFGPLESLEMEDYRRQFDVNIFGPIELTKFFLPHFRSTGNSQSPPLIIYVSSGAAHFGLPLLTAYSASKAALDLFAESLSFELGQLNPPIIVKLIPIHGAIKSTNFLNSSNSSNVVAGWEAEPQNQSDKVREMAKHYGAYTKKVSNFFVEVNAQSMEVEVPAKKIFQAVTDGQTKLRYFESGETGGDLLKARMKGGEDGESLDDVDGRYIDFLRSPFV